MSNNEPETKITDDDRRMMASILELRSEHAGKSLSGRYGEPEVAE